MAQETQKMKIARGSIALIRYTSGDFLNGHIFEGKVLDAKGSCVRIRVSLFKLWIFGIWWTKWYSFKDSHYELTVEQVAS